MTFELAPSSPQSADERTLSLDSFNVHHLFYKGDINMTPRRNKEKFNNFRGLNRVEDYRLSRRRIFLSRNRSSYAVEQFQSEANWEAMDRRAPNNSKNWQRTTEDDVRAGQSTPAPHGGE
ncbi:hypothetical protein TNCV_3108571 [Trichonephila clavipes]|uniref:Uncharacterized protein n=1 Tax=Trichonephila clavipes TaxID=2585209 RepID=A0A8X6S7F3_TRICX|nr:hypothetical protein TNCV_3108571 [Trichonephila clavipes]